jgi:hypothetical protein
MRFTNHAMKRMAERGISEREVAEALEHQQIQYPSQDNPQCSVIIGVTEGGRSLKIVIDNSDQRVVTVVATRE